MLPQPETGDFAHPERGLRDVVALSTLPTIWLGADSVRVAESLAAALFTTIGPELVYVRLDEGAHAPPVSVAQVDRYRTDAALAERLGGRILEWARAHDPDELLSVANPFGPGELHIATQPLGLNAGLGVVAAGFSAAGAPGPLQRTLLGIGATQAASAVQSARLLRSLRESIAERERAEEALREADRRKDEFLAMLSHELRNPLAAIVTAVQVLQLRGPRVPEVGTLERQSAHLTRLVDDLLDVSRITRGKIELRRRSVEIAEAVVRAMEMAGPLLEPRAHRVSVEGVPQRGAAVDADPERLAQVVFNLLSNAAKYSPPGSPITLRAWREGERVLFSVKDLGAGIAPAMTERIFDMFVQQDQTIARSEGGLGLGLTIVRSLVEMHGGKVRVQSAGCGQGSEFTLELPAAAAAGRLGLAEAPPAAAAPQRVLVVDDNVDAATSLGELLRLLGHAVAVAHDGASALDEARRFGPDVALLDIGLPVMDGYELAQRLGAQFAGRQPLRLIALSGYGLERDRERSARAGFSEHLVKPVDLAALERLLRVRTADWPAPAGRAATG